MDKIVFNEVAFSDPDYGLGPVPVSQNEVAHPVLPWGTFDK